MTTQGSPPGLFKMPTDFQDAIGILIEKRGYLVGYDTDQLASRHIAKLAEELAEAAEHVWLPPLLAYLLRISGKCARWYFDRPRFWKAITGTKKWALRRQDHSDRLPHLKAELADCQVVLYSLAEVLSQGAPTRFRISLAAYLKADRDVQRGVRKAGGEQA